jgi:Glyoxalase/Bleomycin resistance protein/Dioxygenase superfamily
VVSPAVKAAGAPAHTWSTADRTTEGMPEMRLSIQASLLNVSDLERSVEFYRDVFELRPVGRGDRVAALMIDETDRRQVLVLREVGAPHMHPGRGSIGPRMLALEAGSPGELEVIEQRLVQRKAFAGRRRTGTWHAVVGIDPDRIEVSVSSGLTGTPISHQDWANLDQMVYEIGE